MPRDPATVDSSLVALLLELSQRAGRPAGEEEARAALAALSPAEAQALRGHARGAPPARPLGPMAWADVARGVDARVAAARELGGYYELQVERDALATLTGQPAAPAPEAPAAPPEPAAPRATRRAAPAEEPAPATPGTSRRRAAPAEASDEPAPRGQRAIEKEQRSRRAQELLTLYAYHRDHPLVARALHLSLAELDEEVDRLKLRRPVGRILRGTDVEMPIAQPTGAASSGPPLRRRKGEPKAPPPAPPPPAAVEAPKPAKAPSPPKLPRKEPRAVPVQRLQVAPDAPPARPPAAPVRTEAELRAALREVGPRRHLLQARLGTPEHPLPAPVLLNLFRDAGLEREFGQRERDLVRGLLSRHRGAYAPIAAELELSVARLEQLVRERGLSAEFAAIRARYAAQARARRWPREQLEQLLKERARLEDLGVFAELLAAAADKVKPLWSRDSAATQPARLQRLGKELKLAPKDARAVAELLGLR